MRRLIEHERARVNETLDRAFDELVLGPFKPAPITPITPIEYSVRCQIPYVPGPGSLYHRRLWGWGPPWPRVRW